MNLYEFTIIASGLDPSAEDFEARFFEGGCDDATVSFQKGHIIIDFAREAISIEEAIASAVQNVCNVGATVERVEPDPLVNLADIASRIGVSRAAVSLYSKGDRGVGFPAPIVRVTSESPLWDWASVAVWVHAHSGKLTNEQVHIAQAVSAANAAIEDGIENCFDGFRERLTKRVKEYRVA